MSSKEFKAGDMVCQSNSMSQEVIELKEYIYMGLSDSTSTESSTISNVSEDIISLKTNDMGSNFKETELRLGLPGCESAGKDLENCQLSIAKLDENLLFPVLKDNGTTSQKIGISGQKRRFSVAMIEFSEKKRTANSEARAMPLTRNTIDFSTKSIKGEINYAKMKDTGFQLVSQEQTCAANKSGANYAIASNNNGEPPAKVQTVGWPPIRSFRTNMLKNNTKEEEEEEEAKKIKGLYVKVSMDGAPYLRKVDLRAYSTYHDLSSALKIMFSCFTLGRYGSHGPEKEITNESKLKDMPQNGCEYLLTYEDKDGDLMLLGDVPWEMFIDTCKRLRIMKGLDAVGLAPRVSEKCRNKS